MPSAKEFLANLAAPIPWPTRARLVLKNNLTKIIRRQGCCGNLGEPGC